MSRANYRGDVVEIAYEIADLEPEDLGKLRELLREERRLVDYKGKPKDEDAAERLREIGAKVASYVGTADLDRVVAAFEHATGLRP